MWFQTFARAASPEAGSGWPMLDLVEPISRGSRFDSQKTLTMPFTSCGSPTCVDRAEVKYGVRAPLCGDT